MLRITNVISHVDRSAAFEWLAEGLKGQFDLEFVLLNPDPNSFLQDFLKSRQIPVRTIVLRGYRDFPKVFFQLIWHFARRRPQVVHTHLLSASILGIAAAYLTGVRHRIVTRHHSTFHHQFAPHFVKVDRWISRLATRIIAVSANVRNVLTHREGVNPAKINLVYNAFDLDAFSGIAESRTQALRSKYEIPPNAVVIGVISRFIKWKGIQFVIPAFAELRKSHPTAILFLANADGPDANELHALLRTLPAESYRVTAFERDVFALYQLFDVFVHVPIDEECEAYGQVYVEALAAGVPSVFTLSGIANEFVKDEENALVVKHQDAAGIRNAIERILRKSLDLDALKARGRRSIEPFSNKFALAQMTSIYRDML